MILRRGSALARWVAVAGVLWVSSYSVALADAAKAGGTATDPGPPMGHGMAYLLGLAGGLAIFVVSLVMAEKKDAQAGAAK